MTLGKVACKSYGTGTAIPSFDKGIKDVDSPYIVTVPCPSAFFANQNSMNDPGGLPVMAFDPVNLVIRVHLGALSVLHALVVVPVTAEGALGRTILALFTHVVARLDHTPLDLLEGSTRCSAANPCGARTIPDGGRDGVAPCDIIHNLVDSTILRLSGSKLELLSAAVVVDLVEGSISVTTYRECL